MNRLGDVEKQYHAAKVRINQLKEQIAASVEADGITLDEETHKDIKVCSIMNDTITHAVMFRLLQVKD